MTKQFQRKIEDFVCGNCGISVKGNGYTNHCPKCLWSKHVDINPGDREEDCHGLMKPISVLKIGERYSLIHQCQKCGQESKNKINENDNFDEIIRLSKSLFRI
ncbi:MAG: RNHCP domain-containing protein [Candidatus Paceibacterota bacterium]